MGWLADPKMYCSICTWLIPILNTKKIIYFYSDPLSDLRPDLEVSEYFAFTYMLGFFCKAWIRSASRKSSNFQNCGCATIFFKSEILSKLLRCRIRGRGLYCDFEEVRERILSFLSRDLAHENRRRAPVWRNLENNRELPDLPDPSIIIKIKITMVYSH